MKKLFFICIVLCAFVSPLSCIEEKPDRWNAHHYKNNSDNQFCIAMESLPCLSLQGDEVILDIGCGDGRITYEIARHIPDGFVIGIDISDSMIEMAEKNFGRLWNLGFQCADGENFICDEEFDVVVSFSAFHWIKDQQKTLRNIFAMLHPGGKLLINMEATQADSPFATVFSSAKWKPLLPKDQSFFPQSPDTFKKMLEDSGFSNIITRIDTHERVMANKEEMVNLLMEWVPHSTGFSDEKALEFSSDIADEVARWNNGVFLMKACILYAQATKP